MIADYEHLQESEVSAIHVKRFKSEVLVKKENTKIPCANGTLDVLIVQDQHG